MRRLPALLPALLLASGSMQAADMNHGGDLYRRHCSACHGPAGRPALPGAPDLTRPGALSRPDPLLVATLREGRGAMPGYGGILKERELFDLVAHLRTLR